MILLRLTVRSKNGGVFKILVSETIFFIFKKGGLSLSSKCYYQIIDGVIKKRRNARELDNASLVCSLQVSYMT